MTRMVLKQHLVFEPGCVNLYFTIEGLWSNKIPFQLSMAAFG